MAKQQLCTFITLFCIFPCRRCTAATRKSLISRFVDNVNSRRLYFSFPELWYCLLKFNARKKLPTLFWRTERDGISAIKFEAVRLHFLSEVFVAVAVAVVVAWAPYYFFWTMAGYLKKADTGIAHALNLVGRSRLWWQIGHKLRREFANCNNQSTWSIMICTSLYPS